MNITDNELDEILEILPDQTTRYLSDNLRILLESKFNASVNLPVRLNGTEIKLLTQTYAYLRREYLTRSIGGAKSKRSPIKNDPKSVANRERVRKFRDKEKDG